MTFRRTRRDVLGATTGLGLALAAGCLDGGGENEPDAGDDGDGGGDDSRPTYREWILAAVASNEVDPSDLTFAQFDLTAIDAVSDSLPDEQERGLREAATNNTYQLAEKLETDSIDSTFSFDARGTTDGTGNVNCRGMEGAFDVSPLREEMEAADDVDRETIAGYDVYTMSRSSIALRSDRVVAVTGEISTEARASLLERVESDDVESTGDGNDVETLAGHLDDGATAIGDFRSSMTAADVRGWGGSVAFDDQEATVRQVTLYDEEPDDETIDSVESDLADGYGLGRYEETTADVNGRTIVVTAVTETERYRGVPW